MLRGEHYAPEITMDTLTNLTRSPYNVRDKDGTLHRLPPKGTIEVELTGRMRQYYKNAGFVELGGEPEPEPDLDATTVNELRENYLALKGEEAPKSWTKAKLAEAIDELLA